MQCTRLFGRVMNPAVLRIKTIERTTSFTAEEIGKRNEDCYKTTDNREQDEKLLQPLSYIKQIHSRGFLPNMIHAFNYWLKVPADRVILVEEIIRMLHDATLLIDDIQDNSSLRRGIPVAHSIYGTASTINAVIYAHFKVMKRAQTLNHPEAMSLCTEQLLELYRGQGMEISWRDNYTCPSTEEYEEMAKRKGGRVLALAVRLMQLSSENTSDFTKLIDILGTYWSILNDYFSLVQQYSQDKDYCEDVTEGKFSFPIIHAIKSHPEDNQVINILRQKTRDVELKKYFITLLEKFGSFSYTKQTLENLHAQVKAEVSKLGGNSCVENVINVYINQAKKEREVNSNQ